MGEIRKSLEISSHSEDEAMNDGNGNLIDSPNNNPGEKLDPSLESAIWEPLRN